jgi:hypothetical protein
MRLDNYRITMSLGSAIRNPGSGKNLSRIPDSEFKQAPDPGSAILDKAKRPVQQIITGGLNFSRKEIFFSYL